MAPVMICLERSLDNKLLQINKMNLLRSKYSCYFSDLSVKIPIKSIGICERTVIGQSENKIEFCVHISHFLIQNAMNPHIS